MHIPKLIAIKIVCHKTNGGRTGLIVASSCSELPFAVRVALVGPAKASKMFEVLVTRRFKGSRSLMSNALEFRAWVHSVSERNPL